MNSVDFSTHISFLGIPLPFRQILKRDPLCFLTPEVIDYYTGKNILITGYGTVGSKLLQLFATLAPRSITFVDFSEQALHDLNLVVSTMGLKFPVRSLLLDLMHYTHLAHYLKPSEYDIVLHTAAYKNLPVVEDNIALPVRNNVIATSNLLRLFSGSAIQKFVYVSTDKAVYPKSVMGASKRFTEKIVLSHPELDTAIVRLGNIFGSRGSLIDDLQFRAVEFGKIQIYTPDMERYFISQREVAELITFAGWQPEAGVTIVPEMSNPVNILAMVTEIIECVKPHLPREVIIESGKARKGEKISEALYYPEEEKVLKHKQTHHSFTLRHRLPELDLDEIERQSDLNNVEYLISALKKYGNFVPEIAG